MGGVKPVAPIAMVLAAGFGSRLGELSHDRPKPMLPVIDTPLVGWAVRWLVQAGVTDIVVNLHHMGETIEAYLGDGSAFGARVRYSPEHGHILGTGGGLRHARPLLAEAAGGDLERPIVVVNAKILLDLDLSAVLALHRARDAEATMVLRPDAEAERWGSLRVGPDDRVVELVGRRAPGSEDASVGPPLMFTGVHVLTPRFLDRIPPEGEQCVIRTAYRSLLDEGRGPHAFVTDRFWHEHSTPARYREGVFAALDGRVLLPGRAAPAAGIDARAHVHPAATVVAPVYVGPDVRIDAGACVGPYVQLGRGAHVASGVTLTRAVVWEGVHVGADACDVVLTREGPVP